MSNRTKDRRRLAAKASTFNYVKKQGSDYVILNCWMEEPYDYDAEALQGEPPRHQRAVTVYEQRVVSGSAGEQ